MQSKLAVATYRSNLIWNMFIKKRSSLVILVGGVWTCVALCSPVPDALAEISVEGVLRDLKVSDREKQRIRKGKIVQWTSSEATDRELAVGLFLLVRGNPENLAEQFRQAAGFKVVEQIKAYGRIRGKGDLADLAGMVLEPNGEKEARRYLDAAPGTTLNLSAKEIAAFKALTVKGLSAAERKKKVEGVLRSTLLARYQAYRAQGLSGIAPYDRGGGKQRPAGQDLLAATKEARVLAKHVPSLHDILLKYPAVEAKNFEEWFHWVNIEVFGRPTFILSHRMLLPVGNAYVVAERHFYASHDYESLQLVAAALPVENGSLLIYLNRVSTEQAGGFGASVKHPVARGLMGPYIKDMFEKIRARAEQK